MEPETQLDSMTNEITLLGPGLLGILLKDRTTRGHILWATDDYCTLGPRYAAGSQILQKLITGANAGLVRPRAVKAQDQRSSRTRNRAEVFTPSWICNAQNNLVDARWFGRPDVFNTSQGHTWTPRRDKISFPPHLTWKQYVDARRLEISCGEAPYLVSRYDSVSGEPMAPPSRIGLLDRKLRIVSENAAGEEEWLRWAYRAYESTYGFEYQGDSLLLARENLLCTFVDYARQALGRTPSLPELKKAALIISWNLWQMDALTCTPPVCGGEAADLKTRSEKPAVLRSAPPLCRIKNWRTGKTVTYRALIYPQAGTSPGPA